MCDMKCDRIVFTRPVVVFGLALVLLFVLALVCVRCVNKCISACAVSCYICVVCCWLLLSCVFVCQGAFVNFQHVYFHAT